jgi:hypothetical protein
MCKLVSLTGSTLSFLFLLFGQQTQLRVTITDATEKRWEVPDIIETTPSSPVVSSSADYDFVLTHYPFAFAVVRKSTGETLFNTSSPSTSHPFPTDA